MEAELMTKCCHGGIFLGIAWSLEVLLFCLLCCLSLAKEYESGSDNVSWISFLKNYTKEPFTIGTRTRGDEETIPYEKIIDITKQKLSQPLKSEDIQISDRETSVFLLNIDKDIKPPVEVEDAKASTQAQESDWETSAFLQNIAKTLKLGSQTPVEVEDAAGSSQEPQNDDEATRLLLTSLFHKKEIAKRRRGLNRIQKPDLIEIPIDLQGNIK